MQWRDDTTRWRDSTTLPSRASATATCSMSALAHFADSTRTSPEVREWDGPAALPPPTTLRVLGGLVRRRSTPMPRASTIHAVIAIGIDLGKNTLHMIGLDSSGAIVLREKVSRGHIASRLANLPPCLIGIEAGMATHYVARELTALGHDVKQVPATYAKPFRQGHKNDFRDAHAVAEAVQRPTTRFVPAKTAEQLDLQALHRVRSRLEMATGGRTIRGRISKRGNGYLRMLFRQAARVILLRPANWPKHGFGAWLTRAAQRLHPNVLAAALANKLARIAWTVLAQERSYESRVKKAAA